MHCHLLSFSSGVLNLFYLIHLHALQSSLFCGVSFSNLCSPTDTFSINWSFLSFSVVFLSRFFLSLALRFSNPCPFCSLFQKHVITFLSLSLSFSAVYFIIQDVQQTAIFFWPFQKIHTLTHTGMSGNTSSFHPPPQ